MQGKTWRRDVLSLPPGMGRKPCSTSWSALNRTKRIQVNCHYYCLCAQPSFAWLLIRNELINCSSSMFSTSTYLQFSPVLIKTENSCFVRMNVYNICSVFCIHKFFAICSFLKGQNASFIIISYFRGASRSCQCWVLRNNLEPLCCLVWYSTRYINEIFHVNMGMTMFCVSDNKSFCFVFR